jgi:hypothetical protein
VLRIVIRMEIGLKKYNEAMSESMRNDIGLRLFRRLAIEESWQSVKKEYILPGFGKYYD